MWTASKNFTSEVQVIPTPTEAEGQHWFQSFVNTVRKYKRGLFGDDSNTCIKTQRMVDYTVPPNYKFVFARYCDGFYRPASIMGRNKKMQLFMVFFYHQRKCCYVKPRDVLLKHGNLLERKVCFCYEGLKRKATVFGNNSPANHGFPSVFYLKKKTKWFKVGFKNLFLTKKQVNKMYFTKPKRRSSSNSSCKNKSISDASA